MTTAPALPRWIYVPAAVGALFVVLPLVAIVAKVDWPQFATLITSESSRAALLLSLKTATASTLLCLLFGVPLALVLARNDGKAVQLCDRYSCCHWCCRRWLAGSRSCTRSAGSAWSASISTPQASGSRSRRRRWCWRKRSYRCRSSSSRSRVRHERPAATTTSWRRRSARDRQRCGGGCPFHFLRRASSLERYWRSPARSASSEPR